MRRDGCRARCWCSRVTRPPPTRLEEELAFFAGAPAADLRVSRLRDAAVRPVLAAPGHHLAAPAHAGAPADADARHRDRRPADGAAAPAAAHVHRWRTRSACASGEELDLEALSRAARGRGLRERAAGRRSRASSRSAARCSTSFRWAARRRCASTCSTTRSTASAASTRRRSARSTSCERLELLPAREFSLSPESIKDFRRRFRTRFEGDLTRMSLYRDVGEGTRPGGHRVLPAAVLRNDRDAARLPAATGA